MAPNGFYIPNLQNEAEKSLMRLDARRASFSAVANVAASPVFPSKSQSRQRQLISGRKFTDILEACRPGTTRHSVPSALSSLLALYEAMQKENQNHNDHYEAGQKGDGHKNDKAPTIEEPDEMYRGSSQLKEWGAVDFDAVDAIISQSPLVLGMKKQDDVGTSVPRDHMSDRSSPTSSFSSHLSSLMSRSLERTTSMFSHGSGFHFRSGPMVDGIQMQRSPSMDSLECIE